MKVSFPFHIFPQFLRYIVNVKRSSVNSFPEPVRSMYYPKVILSHRSKSDFVSNRLDLVNYQTSEGRTDHHQKGGFIIGTGSEVSGCKELRRSSGKE